MGQKTIAKDRCNTGRDEVGEARDKREWGWNILRHLNFLYPQLLASTKTKGRDWVLFSHHPLCSTAMGCAADIATLGQRAPHHAHPHATVKTDIPFQYHEEWHRFRSILSPCIAIITTAVSRLLLEYINFHPVVCWTTKKSIESLAIDGWARRFFTQLSRLGVLYGADEPRATNTVDILVKRRCYKQVLRIVAYLP